MRKKENAAQIKSSIANLRQLAARIVVPEDEIAAASTSETKSANEGTGDQSHHPPNSPSPVHQNPSSLVWRTMTRLQPAILSFVNKLNEKVEKWKWRLENEDMTELAGLAHWLKGAGGTVGYDDFTKPAEALETCAKTDHVEKASQMLEEVKSLVMAIVPPVIVDSAGHLTGRNKCNQDELMSWVQRIAMLG